ncbi:hypothetical protein MA16_Dca017967 [Dendrobium catenatum]|uniref:Uncharacterized protein n=1 Tax=Dendrobium catenatum TaxID=906689 RepID=A0A2I0W259_9ASPA|nr:hypothetical protein MA16_Dca017967 [Dendrobium catenatum]
MTMDGRRPSAAGGQSEDRSSTGRSNVGSVRDISSSPPAFGDGKISFFTGLKSTSMMNMPLIINEGGLMMKKQILEVPGKEKCKISEGFLENSGKPLKKQIEKVNEMLHVSAVESNTSVVMKEVESNVISNNCLDNTNAVNEINDIILEKRFNEDKNTNSEKEKIRSCTTGELGKCEEMLEVMSQRINSANNQNAWNRNKNTKVADLDYGDCIAEDGCTVKLHKEKVCENAMKLNKSLVVKIFGEDIQFSSISY